MSERQTKAGNQECYEKLEKLSHPLTLSIIHSPALNMLNNFCFHVYAQKSLFHTHTLSLSQFFTLIHSLLTCWTTFVFMSMLKYYTLTLPFSHSPTLSLSHSLTLGMLHEFCFQVDAKKSVFIGENGNVVVD